MSLSWTHMVLKVVIYAVKNRRDVTVSSQCIEH